MLTYLDIKTPNRDPNPHRNAAHLRALGEPRPAVTPTAPEAVAVRILGDADRASLRALAGRDSALVPIGRVLGAEIGGRLVAALSLDDGSAISDPFRASTDALQMLRLRSRQLHASRRFRLPRRKYRRVPARARLGGSPPGGGGRLLNL